MANVITKSQFELNFWFTMPPKETKAKKLSDKIKNSYNLNGVAVTPSTMDSKGIKIVEASRSKSVRAAEV